MPTIPHFLWEYQLPLGLAVILLPLILYLFSWYKDVNHNRSDFRKLLKNIKKDIEQIKDRLSGTPAASTSNSPLELTSYGKKLSDCLNAQKWVAETADALESKVHNLDAYQIQEFCNDYAFNQFQPSDLQAQKIRDCMFQHGATKTHVNEVLSLVLRDKLLLRWA